jgi:hypothetical protein
MLKIFPIELDSDQGMTSAHKSPKPHGMTGVMDLCDCQAVLLATAHRVEPSRSMYIPQVLPAVLQLAHDCDFVLDPVSRTSSNDGNAEEQAFWAAPRQVLLFCYATTNVPTCKWEPL